jgi:16S rRNA (guanine966-N2)-methyltransferase|tara:strand:- start:445 stop:1014 length:570 start_codon:yes stop_codon:yes gene_type:complete
MRIISGKFKNKKLFIPLNKEIRPLKDITKESIFNILIHFKKFLFKFKNSKILDLYSGSGSFGLECLSRGANKVIFVENNKNALKILEKNIFKLNIEKKTSIIKQSVFNYLSNIDNFNYRQDLIFLDPPYKEKNIFELINNIIKANILKKNGIIIIHRNKKSEDNYPNNFTILDIRKYGISKIIFGYLTS